MRGSHRYTQNDLLDLELKYKKNDEVLGLIHALQDGVYVQKIQSGGPCKPEKPKIINRTIQEVTRELILNTYDGTGRNRAKTAEILGLSMRALKGRLERLGVA